MAWFCKKCNEKMREAVLEEYEHEEGIPLKEVSAYVCPNCHDFLFSEEQLELIEKRTRAIKVHLFTLRRRLTISGRSLSLNIPEDVVKHLKLKKGQDISLRVIDDTHVMIETK